MGTKYKMFLMFFPFMKKLSNAVERKCYLFKKRVFRKPGSCITTLIHKIQKLSNSSLKEGIDFFSFPYLGMSEIIQNDFILERRKSTDFIVKLALRKNKNVI